MPGKSVLDRIRLFALVLAVLAGGAAVMRGLQVRHFLRVAQHVQGHVVGHSTNGQAEIGFPVAGRQQQQTTLDWVGSSMGSAVALVYTKQADGGLDVRLDAPAALWKPMWTWIEVAFALFLLAVYGRALVEDPASVIGFKSWRLTQRKTLEGRSRDPG